MRREHDDRNIEPSLRKRLDDIEPASVRHLQIKDNTVEFAAAIDIVEKCRAGSIDLGKEMEALQQPVHCRTDRGVVINDRYSNLTHVAVFCIPQGCMSYQQSTMVNIRPWSNAG